MQKLSTVIPAIFNKIRPGATFLSVMGYQNNYEEVSNFGIVFHVDYFNAVRKALNIWQNYKPTTQEEKVARVQLIDSYSDSLRGQSRSTSAHVYTPIVDGDGNLIKGVKWFTGGREIHLWGFVVHRVVVSPGNYPETRSNAVTLAKKALLKQTPLSKFRQYKLVPGRFDHVGVQKLTLTHKDLLRQL